MLSKCKRLRTVDTKTKQAIIFPMVLVFFFLSQLSYLGILQVHQDKMRRYQNFSNYYQAKVQEAMIRGLLSQTDELVGQDLEQAILASQERMQAGLRRKFPWLSSVDLGDMQGIRKLESGLLDQERLLDFQFKLYLEDRHAGYCQFFQELTCAGILDAGGLPQDIDQVDKIDLLIDPSFRPVRLDTYNYLDTWTQTPSQIAPVYYFDQGQVETNYRPDGQYLELISRLYANDFVSLDHLELKRISFLIIWQGQVWQRPV